MDYKISKRDMDDTLHSFFLSSFMEKIKLKTNIHECPASTWHGRKDVSLAQHSLSLMRNLVEYTLVNSVRWENENPLESCIKIGLLHDLCKTRQYIKVKDGDSFVWKKKEGIPKNDWEHHGLVSWNMCLEFAQDTDMIFTEEEEFCIKYHMGCFDMPSSMWGNVIGKYPNVLLTHFCDNWCSLHEKTNRKEN